MITTTGDRTFRIKFKASQDGEVFISGMRDECEASLYLSAIIQSVLEFAQVENPQVLTKIEFSEIEETFDPEDYYDRPAGEESYRDD